MRSRSRIRLVRSFKGEPGGESSRRRCAGWGLPLFLFLFLAAAPPATGIRAAAAPQPVVKSFPAVPGGSLVADVAAGDIIVTSGEQGVQVSVAGLPEELAGDLVVEQAANTVRVEFHPSHLMRRWSALRFEFTVPPDYNLDLRTSGGDVRFQGSLRGEIRAKTAGGDFHFDQLGGRVSLSTSGGDIAGGRAEGDVELHTSGGDIRLTDAAGNVKAKTSGGDITVQSCTGDLSANTAGGAIELGTVRGRVSAQTAGGDIAVDHVAQAAELKTAGGDIRVRRVDEGLEASTAGGDLHLSSVAGSFSVKTAGGDISLELAGPVGGGSARTAGGDIALEVPPGAAVTIRARIELRGDADPDDYAIRCLIPGVEPEITKSSDVIRTEIRLNGGGPIVELETANGNITIRSAGR